MKYVLFFFFVITGFTAVSQQSDAVPDFDQTVDQLMNNYQFESALQLLNNKNDSLDTNLLQRRGYCFFRLGNYSGAIRQYQRITAIDSMNRNALVQLAQLYSKSNLYADSYECYRKLITRDSLNSYYYKQYGVVASQSNDLMTSLTNFEMAIKLNPRDVEAFILLGNLLLEMERYGEADTLMSDALTLNRSPQLRLLLAKAQFGEERYEEVVKTTEQLMTNGDTLTVYSRLLGISYFQLGQYDKVIPFMKFLLNSDLKAEWIYYYMGVSYQQLHQPDTAISYLNKAIEAGISDNIHNDYLQLATTYEEIKDFKSAIKYYKAAYETTKSGILLYHLARNYDVFYKDKAQAIAYYKRYLNSDDTIRLAKEYTKFRLDELSVYR